MERETVRLGYAAAPSCVPIPAGVARLVTVLTALELDRLGAEDCATVFP